MRTTAILLLLQCLAFAGPRYAADDLELQNGVFMEKKTGEPATGCFVSWLGDQDVRRETPLLSGIVDGVVRMYLKNGAHYSEEEWREGKQEGATTYYDGGGKVRKVENFKAGVLEGRVQEIFENGAVKVEGQYADNEKNGRWVRYAESGEVLEMMEFDAGILKSELLSGRDAERFWKWLLY